MRTRTARVLGAGCAAVALATTSGAWATTAEDICGLPIPDPCVITTEYAITDGSLLDFGSSALVLRTLNGRLDVGTGTMRIAARSVRLETGAKLLGAGGTIAVAATDQGAGITIASGARIDVSSTAGGGQITLVSAGPVMADGDLLAAGKSIPAIGGKVVVFASGDVLLDDVDASGGYQASARYDPARGSVRIVAGGALVIDGNVDVSHGDCTACAIRMHAEGDLTVDHLDAHATGTGSDAGEIDIDANGSVTLNGTVTAQGAGGDPDTGGSGGTVGISAGQDVFLNQSFILHGAPPDGDGGWIDVDAGRDILQAAGSVIDTDGGGTGCGGASNAFAAGRDLRIDTLTAVGDSCGAGSLDASADRDATVADTLNLNATADGTAGDISIEADRTLTVSATIRASGGAAGEGGSIDLEACNLQIDAGISLLADGEDGSNVLIANEDMTMAGRMEAGDSNRLIYGDASNPPIITGVILPTSVPELDAALEPCATSAVCGNGVIERREECDDGNTLACDGCSATCGREICGNHRLDCNETCDPPDGFDCDDNCQVIPRPVQRLAGRFRTTGCQAEWELALAAPAIDERSGLPKTTQACIDGDPGCDVDGASDGACTIPTRVCLHAADPRLPRCTPAPITTVNVRVPRPLSPADATDEANAGLLVDGVAALGVSVTAGATALRTGTADPQIDHCTETLDLRIPHTAQRGTRTFSIGAGDLSGHRLKSNVMKLECLPNTAVCGDGTVGIGEACDDGNLQACDGCSPTCHIERCGNGIIDCAEQCDEGVNNGTPGANCTADCTVPPPALRIPGGRSRFDCGLEFSLTLDPTRVARDRHGLPSLRQTCTDGDPTCDLDPRPGACRWQVYLCVGGADPRISCAADGITGLSVLKPHLPGDPTLTAVQSGVDALGLPRPAGETCSGPIPIVLATTTKTTLRLRALLASGRPDTDTLKLACLAPP